YDIISVYLRGSVALADSPLLGGAADIDLVFIHNERPQVSREILYLTDDVHLDIAHHDQKEYLDRRALRVDPWMGPSLFNAKVLFDPQHFIDFTLASVRGMFESPENVIQRAQPLIVGARQTWLNLKTSPEIQDNQFIGAYLRTLFLAANALALLVGEPLTKRRFLNAFSARVARLDRPGMYAGLMGLIGAPQIEIATLESWVSAWDISFGALQKEARPINLHLFRRNYYLRFFAMQLTSEAPKNILWPLLQTWTQAVAAAPLDHTNSGAWVEACQHLGLLGDNIADRIAGLGAYLDQVEDVIDSWAGEQGV
ncbi:MAG: hypothetical protein IMY76_07200, partial [Chloroflexi bacterium]|nr:hypothetical protein [Chloroflexota bacterium]